MVNFRYVSLLLLILVNPVFAHGTGTSFEEQIGNYLVDVGYTPRNVVSNETMRFDFSLIDTREDGPIVSFSDVWVRIEKDGTTFFAGGVHKPVFGPTGVTYIFPEAGVYTVNFRFQNDGEKIVESTFPIEVLPDPTAKDNSLPIFVFGLILGLFVGVSGMFILKRK